MEISYDKQADAMYKNGNILGIKLLDVSKRIPAESLTEVSVKNLLAAA